jgi:hypothetical protein
MRIGVMRQAPFTRCCCANVLAAYAANHELLLRRQPLHQGDARSSALGPVAAPDPLPTLTILLKA